MNAVFAAALELYSPGEAIPSMIDIARKAGVQKTTLYRRWTSAEALLHAAISQSVVDFIPAPDTGTLRGDLRALATAGHAFLSTPAGQGSITMLLHADAASRGDYWAKRYGQLEIIFDRAKERGELNSGASWQSFLDIIIGTTCFTILLKGERIALEDLLGVVDLICGGR